MKKNNLNQIPPMHHAKSHPLAIATPDSTKLIVFSTCVWFVPPQKNSPHDDHICYFELYDQADRSWRKLPKVCDNWRDDDPRNAKKTRCSNSVHVCTFISKSVLFIETDVGMFSIDLELIDSGEGWKRLDSFYGYHGRSLPGYSLSNYIVGDGLLLTSVCAYDIGTSTLFMFPESASTATAKAAAAGASMYPPVGRAMVVVDSRDGECNFSIAQTGVNEAMNEEWMCPYVIADVYRLDLIQYNQERDNKNGGCFLPGTSIIKSFRFVLDVDPCDWNSPLYLFSI